VRQTSRWRWWIHLILISVFPALGLLVGLVKGHVDRGPALSGDVPGLLWFCGVELLLFAILFAPAWLISRATREQLMLVWRPGWWVAPLGLLYSIALRLALGMTAAFVFAILAATRIVTPEKAQAYALANRPDVEVIVSISALKDNPVYFWLTITLVSFVLGGLREEMWRAGTLAAMRVLWPRIFNSWRGQFLAVTLIAVIFGFLHLRMGVLAAAGAGILGLFLGVIMVLHRSIWPAVIAHGFFDATSMAILPWAIEKIRQLH
jgi:membrane protease YdiL (CAAX protease family)